MDDGCGRVRRPLWLRRKGGSRAANKYQCVWDRTWIKAEANEIVFAPSKRRAGFDAEGNPAGYTNKPIQAFKFKQVYSTTNNEGEVFPGVGNLPATVTILKKSTPSEYRPEQSSFSDKIFNPRALVIFQDSTTEDPTNPVHINRPYFSLEDTEIAFR